MSRSGYCEDLDQWELQSYRGRVANAIKGKRGQQFLKDLMSALDAMPNKRLIPEKLESNGDFCAIGVLGHARGIEMRGIDETDSKQVASVFNIAPCLAAEIAFVNDDEFSYREETPEHRWVRVRRWTEEQIAAREKLSPEEWK